MKQAAFIDPPPPGSRMSLRPEPYAHLERERTYDALDGLAAEARDRGVSMAGLALAWVLAHPQVTAVIVGPRRPEQLEPVREALSLGLSPGDRERIGAVFE